MLFEEVPFIVFLERNPHLKNRPINEQSFHYHDYISQCQMQLRYMIECGDGIGDTNFILQENDDFLLQEDGYKLIWKL